MICPFSWPAIHFYNRENNEIYFFVRRTETDQFNDIYADAVGIAPGRNTNQIEAFELMYKETLRRIKTDNQGCMLRCQYCHNAHTWAYDKGKTTTANEILTDIEKY
ncbi:MAG: DUF6792 domain-containing protein [Bacillus sp. (in: firmicutes)]